MVAADVADRLVRLRRANLLRQQPVSRPAVKGERGLLQLRGAEREHARAGIAASLLGIVQHHACQSASAVPGIDIHAPQLGRWRAEPLEAEHACKLLVIVDNKERAPPLRIVVGEPVDLIAQRDSDVALESVAKSRRGKLAIDVDEKIANCGMVAVAIAAEREPHVTRRLGFSASSAPRTRSSCFSAAPSTFRNSSFSPSIASTMASAITSRANHLLSAGTTYQGASSRLVWRIASS